MNEQKLRQVAELTDGVVCRHRGLRSFESSDPDADVSFLNHGDVVGACGKVVSEAKILAREAERTIADSQSHGTLAVLDELDRERLLRGRDSAADDRLALRRELEEHGLERLVESVAQRLAVDYDREASRLGRLLVGQRTETGLLARDLSESGLDLGSSALLRVGGNDHLRRREVGQQGQRGGRESAHNLHLVREQVAAEANLDRSLKLVACEK